MSADVIEIGSEIDGYRVDELIGEGSFGFVYACTELELERRVAIKILRQGPVLAEFGRLAKEGQRLASLNHPNIVQIYRLGHWKSNSYIVMEYVSGTTLRQVVAGERPTIRAVLEIMRQVATGLAAMHAGGILHRDLSPSNIMVTRDGTAKILDLGQSRVVDGRSVVETQRYIEGALPYVSPEEVLGRTSGFQSEVFSFSVILYEALAGIHPFRAEHSMSLLYQIAHHDPESLMAHVSDCPTALAGLVARCLAKRPEDRPAGMEVVERELLEIMKLPNVGTPTPRRAVSSARVTSRNPYLNRVMIKHREDFFGRAQEIKRICARLNATPPGSISVVGDRKIGKSSLLNHVYSRASREEHLDQPDQTIMVFLDLQQEKNMSMESFVRTLLGIAHFELRGRLSVTDCALTLDGIRDLVQRLEAAGFRLVILLDEFEAVTTNPNFNLEFFSFLRFLANHYNVSYITSSARDLQVLCHTKEISDSPFFNIFSTMRLSVMQRHEAEDLIRIPSERVGRPLAPFSEQILDMAGLFPFLIQLACSHAVEYLDDHPDAQKPDFGEVGRRFYEEASLHYRYVWDGFDDHEKSTVLRVSGGKGMPDALQHVLAELTSRHLVENDRGRSRLFASTFDEFVRAEARRGSKETFLSRLFGK